MHSPTRPEIPLHYTKLLLSLNVNLSFFVLSFIFLDSSLLSSVRAHKQKDLEKGQNTSIWLHFKYGRNKEGRTTVAGRWAPLPSDMH